MDPSNPVRPVNDTSLSNVQRWVASVLTVTTVFHLAVGLIFASFAFPEEDTGARIGMALIAGVFGMMGVAGALAIHGRSFLSPWLLCGFLPGAVGIALVLR
jgi:hypothetical protein